MKDGSEIIKHIADLMQWLDENIHSDDIVTLGRVLDKLSLLGENLGEMVSDAYALQNELEDEYKISVAEYRKNTAGGIAKVEIEAEVEYAQKKRDWTFAKNGYMKLRTRLDRIDKILESHRQRISVLVKTGLKNMV